MAVTRATARPADDASGDAASSESLRADLAERLRVRRSEIEETIFADVHVGFDPAGREDAEYIAGVRAAISEVMDYDLVVIEHGEHALGSIPPAAVSQAGRAARNGVNLETVLRRYTAGHTFLQDVMMQEIERGGRPSHGVAVRQLLRTLGALLDHFTVSVAREYHDELERVARSPELRLMQRVQSLLAGGRVEAADLGYELDAWHLGIIATGRNAKRTVKELAASLGRPLLSVSRSDETAWAWLGGQRKTVSADLERLLPAESNGLMLALGEPHAGIEGWRLTFHQAQAAMAIALRSSQRLTRYADVALLAAVLRDEQLARSLVELHLAPLGDRTDGGAAARETLRAYFAAGRNAAAAAAALGVNRHTVARRLHTIEEQLGRLLPTCEAELEVALRLEELGEPAAPADDHQSLA
jgi:hypothetical protein